MMCEMKIPCPIHREERLCWVQCVEAEMHNFKLREVYHTQQALKDFQQALQETEVRSEDFKFPYCFQCTTP